jgi:hypothetical protein
VKYGTALGLEELPAVAALSSRTFVAASSEAVAEPGREIGGGRPRSSSSDSFCRLRLRVRRVVGEWMNSVANAVEDVAFADPPRPLQHLPKSSMDPRERKRCALRLQLLLDLDQDVGAVGSQVLRFLDALGLVARLPAAQVGAGRLRLLARPLSSRTGS